MLADQAVVVPSPATDGFGAAAREAGVACDRGQQREPTGSTIYNTLLYSDPDGNLLGKHRKLMPTGAERTVWGMGDGSTLDTFPTPFGRIGGLICWENYMPLARAAMYREGRRDLPRPDMGQQRDAWVATLQHIAKESRSYVHRCQPVRARRPDPGGLSRPGARVADQSGRTLSGWSPATRVIVGTERGDPRRTCPAQPRPSCSPSWISPRCGRRGGCSTRSATTTRPDVFRLAVDTAPRPVVAATLRRALHRRPELRSR